MSALGHQRQMLCEPTGGLFPLSPKTGNVNAQQQNAALCHERTYAALGGIALRFRELPPVNH